MGFRSLLCVGFISILLIPQARAQEFAREISQFVGENARPFLQPIADGLHTGVDAGLFSAGRADGFHLGVRLVAMGVIVPDEQKTFRPKPYSKTVEFTYNGLPFLGDLDIAPNEFPTAAGLSRKETFTGRLKRIRPKGSPYIPGVNDLIQQDATVTVGGYQDLSTILLATPQITVGSLSGTELVLRFLPTIKVENVGEIKSFGVGLKHDVGRHLSLPIDVAGQIMYQSLTLNASDKEFNVDVNQSTVSLQLYMSKAFPFGIVSLMPYTGFGFESGSLDVAYKFADPYIGKQSLTFSSGNRFRFVGGLYTKVWKVTLNADYNFALMNGFSVGLGMDI